MKLTSTKSRPYIGNLPKKDHAQSLPKKNHDLYAKVLIRLQMNEQHTQPSLQKHSASRYRPVYITGT